MKKMYVFALIFLVFIVSISIIGSSIVSGDNPVSIYKDIFTIQEIKLLL